MTNGQFFKMEYSYKCMHGVHPCRVHEGACGSLAGNLWELHIVGVATSLLIEKPVAYVAEHFTV